MLYEYIWKGGPDRVKRDILAQRYDKGGLVDVERFNAALKLSWIKRFFTNMDVWSGPLKRLTLQNPLIWQVGSGLSLKTNNPFWDDVLKAWDLFRLKIQLKYSEDFVNEPLWYNPKCNTGELLIQNWFRKVVRNVRDLLNGKGQVLNFQEFKEKYNVKGTLLDYERVLHCIPNEWLNRVDMVEEYTPRIEKALKTHGENDINCHGKVRNARNFNLYNSKLITDF